MAGGGGRGAHGSCLGQSPSVSLLHQSDGQGGCVGWGPRQRQKGQDRVSGRHCLGQGQGPEPIGSQGALQGRGGGAGPGRGAASSHDAASTCTPALCCFPFCNYRNYRGLLQTAFTALLSFLSETLRFKKKINIGFGCMPKGNIMVYSLLFRRNARLGPLHKALLGICCAPRPRTVPMNREEPASIQHLFCARHLSQRS